jgi:hypothetical protein
MKNNTYIRKAYPMMLFSMLFYGLQAQTPFFSENFNRGIPSTWTTGGTSAKFTACDSTCLRDYARFSPAFGGVIGQSSVILPGSTFMQGSAALKAIRQTNLNATLTAPAINCTGKEKVFVRFATAIWGGANADTPQTSANAGRTCMLRVSNDGTTWKSYPIFSFNIRDFRYGFADISDIAANKSRVLVQFMRMGPEDNQIWIVDDVTISETAPVRNIKISVDMSNERVSAKGVHIAVEEKGGWKPNAVKMTAMGNGMYSGTIQVQQSQKVRYKFMNGDSWGENESVPTGCGEKNAAGYHDRVVMGGEADSEEPIVCFGSCMPCGNTRPKINYEYCPRDPNILYCENFESMTLGKLIPQSPMWATPSLLNGAPPAVAPDNPNIVSYWNGYANNDGSKSLRVQFTSTMGSDFPLMDLQSPMRGNYQLDYRLYIPKGYGGNMTHGRTRLYALFWRFVDGFKPF